jgi:hypothetical protein
MKNALKILLVFAVIAYLVMATGCSRSSRRNRSRRVVVERNETTITYKRDPFDQIAEQNYYDQLRADEEHQRRLKFWDEYPDRTRDTMSKFNRNVYETNKIKRQNSGGFFNW